MRKVLFQKPFGVTSKGRRFYRAMVNGVWVEGDYNTVSTRHDNAKREHAKEQREAKKKAV